MKRKDSRLVSHAASSSPGNSEIVERSCVHIEDRPSVSMATGHAYLFNPQLLFTQMYVIMPAVGVVSCRLVRCSTRSKR